MEPVNRVVRYLAGTTGLGVRYGPEEDLSGNLIGWTDSSWADCRDTSRAMNPEDIRAQTQELC